MTEAAPVVLLLAFLMPGSHDGIQYRLLYPSVEECAADALEFLKHGAPRAPKGAVTMMAGCQIVIPDGEDG